MNSSYNIFSLLRLFLRKWWILLICAVVASAALFFYTQYFTIPVYQTSGSLFIRNTSSSQTGSDGEVRLDELMTSQELLKTYMEILNSERFYNRLRSISGLTYSNNAMQNMISMASKNQTEVLQISVIAPRPADAYILLETILAAAQDEIQWIVGGGSIKVLDHATYPNAPIPSATKRNTAIGFMVGLLLAMGAVVIIDMLDRRVKDSDDLTAIYNQYVLGEIPQIHA